MKLRDPKQNPKDGDVLYFKGYTVEVTGLDGELVCYTKSKDAMRIAASQSISDWRQWTPDAKVRLRGASACIKSAFASGPCVSCRKQMSGPVHITSEGVKCDDCCTCT